MQTQEQTPVQAVRRRVTLIGALYVTQGIPMGVTMMFIPTLMRQHGVALDAIGFTALAMLPWAVKFLWAPWVDRYGTRRTWILPLQCVLAFGFQQLFGTSIYAFSKNRRLHEARLLLESGALPVKAVARQFGYSAAGFSTVFRQRFGVAPSALTRV